MTAGPMLLEAPTQRQKTFSCRWNRSSGNSAAEEMFIGFILTIEVSKPTPVGGSVCTRVFRRLRNDLGFDTRSIWASMPENSRYPLRPSDCGKAPMAAAWKAWCDRRLPLIGLYKVGSWLGELQRRCATTISVQYHSCTGRSRLLRGFSTCGEPASLSPVLGRWTTLNDFFHLTDRPYESLRPEPDLYQTPYLSQAVAKHETSPVGRLASHHKLRARYDAISSTHALARAIALSPAGEAPDSSMTTEGPSFEEVEDLIETSRHDEARAAIAMLEEKWPNALARSILANKGTNAANAPDDHRPGYLVFNPLSVPRRAAVILPEAALDLRPEGPLRVAQFTDEGVYGVVDLPSFGFAWVPKTANTERPPAAAGDLTARGRKIRNEFVEIEIDAATGGIRSLAAVGESSARLGQQFVMTGLVDAQGKPTTSKMRAERFELDYGGPALVQATSSGSLIDIQNDKRLASFIERFRLWAGRPVLEIDITLSDLDTAWLERAADADPYSVYLACRWAWPDPSSMLRRGVFWSPEITDIERPETPVYFDISTRSQRTAILFKGLPYHRKHGGRMLDTLLIAGRERARSFSVGAVLDLENPAHTAQESMTPALVVPVEGGPPSMGPSGWLAQADSKNVLISRLEFVDKTGTDRSWGLAFHLLETSGHATRCRLRLFRNPSWARQVDFQGDTIIDLTVQEDAVLIDFTPYELVRIEVTLG